MSNIILLCLSILSLIYSYRYITKRLCKCGTIIEFYVFLIIASVGGSSAWMLLFRFLHFILKG